MGGFKRENSLGALPVQDIAYYLIGIGEVEEAGRFVNGGVSRQGFPGSVVLLQSMHNASSANPNAFSFTRCRSPPSNWLDR